MNSEREFDIIIYGATSYTGKLGIKHLFNTYGPHNNHIKYALAGRSRERLDDIIRELNLPLDTPTRACPLNEVSLRALARETVVIVNFVGPFATYGEQVVKACIEESTHYVDSSGELDWCELLSSKYHDQARDAGVKILPCMGFDYTLFDMGMAILHNEKLGRWKGSQVVCTSSANTKGISHGTMATLLKILDEGPIVKLKEEVNEATKKNLYIIPKFLRGLRLTCTVMGPGTAGYLEWINKTFNRNQWSDGRDSHAPMNFVIGQEAETLGKLVKNALLVVVLMLYVGVLAASPNFVREMISPKTGHGPELPGRGFVKTRFRFYADQDAIEADTLLNLDYNHGEAYVMTGVTCIESALTMVHADTKTPEPKKKALPVTYPSQGGVGSGSTLLGDSYRLRLQNAGFDFKLNDQAL